MCTWSINYTLEAVFSKQTLKCSDELMRLASTSPHSSRISRSTNSEGELRNGGAIGSEVGTNNRGVCLVVHKFLIYNSDLNMYEVLFQKQAKLMVKEIRV